MYLAITINCEDTMEEVQKFCRKLVEDYQLDPIIYPKNKFLLKVNEINPNVYFIKEGEVNILRDDLILWQARANEIIGLSSYFSGSDFSRFSVKANTKCVVYPIPYKLLSRELEANFELSLSLMNLMSTRINWIDFRIRGLIELPINIRLIKTILRLAKEAGSKSISIKTNELAGLIGSSVRKVRKILSELEDKKLITILRGKLDIIDYRGLEIISTY